MEASGRVLPKGHKKVVSYKASYEFRWTARDQQTLIELSNKLDEDIILQSFVELFPVVVVTDASL